MKYKLIATDLDGSLINDNEEISERNQQAINKAIEAGVLFVTATGRPFMNTGIVRDFLSKDMPFIVLNGAEIYMGKSEKLLVEKFLDFELAHELFEQGQERGVSQIIWTGTQMWTNRICDETVRYQHRAKCKEILPLTDFTTLKDQNKNISKMQWIVDPDNVKALSSEMSSHFGDRLTCASSLVYLLEFIGNNCGKGIALADLGKLFGIDRTKMIAIGDAYNDVCMIKYAGLGIAVGNAPDDIKAEADYVTVSNNDDAVAEVIERFILPTT